MVPILQSFFSHVKLIAGIPLLFGQNLIFIMLDCLILEIHLCYYTIAHYVKVLGYEIEKNTNARSRLAWTPYTLING